MCSTFAVFATGAAVAQQLRSNNAVQVEEPLYFVNFLREPVTDAETGEVVEAHPSFYEAVHGGLPDVRKRVEALQVRAGRV